MRVYTFARTHVLAILLRMDSKARPARVRTELERRGGPQVRGWETMCPLQRARLVWNDLVERLEGPAAEGSADL